MVVFFLLYSVVSMQSQIHLKKQIYNFCYLPFHLVLFDLQTKTYNYCCDHSNEIKFPNLTKTKIEKMNLKVLYYN